MKKSKIFIFVFLFIVFITGCTDKKIGAPLSSKECIGKEYKIIEEEFKKAGFSNINLSSEEKGVLDIFVKENSVKKISINSIDNFSKNQAFDSDSEINIIFYLKQEKQNKESKNSEIILEENEAKIPLSANECKGKDFEMVKNQFEDAGFTNIKLTEKIDESIFGKVGKVEQVTISGNNSFKKGDIFKKDQIIRITYYIENPEFYLNEDENMENDDEIHIVEVKENKDIYGQWSQNSVENTDETYMGVIDSDTITIYVYFSSVDELLTYWTGSFNNDFDVTKESKIVSKNYKYITDAMVNVSHNDEKEFIYKDSTISFDSNFLGKNSNVILYKTDLKNEEGFITIKYDENRKSGFDDNNKVFEIDGYKINYPSYFDSKEEISTEQSIEFFNSKSEANASLSFENIVFDESIAKEDLKDQFKFTIDEVYKGVSFLDVKEIETDAFNGVMGIYTIEQGLGIECWIPLNNDNKKILSLYIKFYYDDKTDNDYIGDFFKIIDNIENLGNAM